MTPSYVEGKFVLRFVIGSRLTDIEDVDFAWNEIKSHAYELEKDEK